MVGRIMDGTADIIKRAKERKKAYTYMLVLSSPSCCDKVYESVFCTPMRTWLVLLNGKGLVRQNETDFKGFIISSLSNIIMLKPTLNFEWSTDKKQTNNRVKLNSTLSQTWLRSQGSVNRVPYYNHLQECLHQHWNLQIFTPIMKSAHRSWDK